MLLRAVSSFYLRCYHFNIDHLPNLSVMWDNSRLFTPAIDYLLLLILLLLLLPFHTAQFINSSIH